MRPGASGLREIKGLRLPRLRSGLFWAVGAAAAALALFAVFFAVSGVGEIGPASRFMIWLLAFSFFLILTLAVSVGARVLGIVRQARSRPETGGRLHLRFVLLFCAAAATPAFLVAVFLGITLSQGVDQWFSRQVRTVVEDAAAVGRAYLNVETNSVRGELLLMAGDLNNAVAGLQQDPQAYTRYLVQQAELRAFSNARVLNRRTILAEADMAGQPKPPPPSAGDFAAADSSVMLLKEGQERITALIRLNAYDDAYLQVQRPYDPGIEANLTRFSQATEDYRQAESRRRRIQSVFWLAYVATTALVLVGAMWIGLGGASRIAQPIGRLADAARRVAQGDLKARVAVSGDRDEVDELARAFNGMTAQLESQHSDLVRASEEAERRSRFIQAVLSGVSAGVIGIDRDERITAANRSAAALLGVQEGALEGRRLVDIAPELSELLSARGFQSEDPIGLALQREQGALHLSVRVAEEPDGAGLVITFDDMTKLVAAQRVEAWKDVARRIAHEIKNPLTPIQLSAERLRRKFGKEIASDPETFERCTQTILRQVSDIGRMVDEFSALARMPAPRPADEDVLELLRATAYGQSVAFEDVMFPIDLRGEAPATLYCDGRLLAQAYTNLLKNAGEAIEARRAMKGEPKEGLVQTSLAAERDRLIIEVADNGVGFPQHNREKLVEPYVTTRAKGTGLGLAIVRRIVEDHGGALELGDSLLGGALVRILLPRRLPPQDPTNPREEANVV